MTVDTPQGDAERSRAPAVNTINSEPEPDEANTQFATAISTQIVLKIGTKLRDLGQDDLTVQSLANLVIAFFWRELGLERRATLDSDPITSGDKSAPQAVVVVDPDALARDLKRIAIAEPTELCSASANIRSLANLLNLKPVEQKLLAWSFAASYSDRAELLDRLAYELKLTDAEHKYSVLATLLDEPVDDVRSAFVSGRLLALRLFGPRAWHAAAHLSHVLSPTYEALALLQTQHRSHNALMVFLLEPEFDCALVVDPSTPSSLFRECFPDRIAEVYERTVKQQPLRALYIASVIQWFAVIEVSAERLEPLAGRLDFETIRETIKRCFVDCSKRDVATGEFELLKALYAAAN